MKYRIISILILLLIVSFSVCANGSVDTTVKDENPTQINTSNYNSCIYSPLKTSNSSPSINTKNLFKLTSASTLQYSQCKFEVAILRQIEVLLETDSNKLTALPNFKKTPYISGRDILQNIRILRI